MNNVNESGFDVIFELYVEIKPMSKDLTYTINITMSCFDVVITESQVNGYMGAIEDFIKGYLEDRSNIQRARDNIARISKRIGFIE